MMCWSIKELPVNAFSSLQNLNTLYLNNNSFEVIYSNSFGNLSNLKNVRFDNNKINAIDRNFVTKTGVISLNMIGNNCSKENIFDNSTYRYSMLIMLSDCFKNFDEHVTESTTIPTTTTVTHTSTPSTTFSTSITFTTSTTTSSTSQTTSQSTEQDTTTDNSTPPKCSDENIDERVCEIEDEIEILNNRDKTFASAIEELQNKVFELTNRPCACS
ncbi:hypothetical protein ACKWTF_001576 [Chironomus riparius]